MTAKFDYRYRQELINARKDEKFYAPLDVIVVAAAVVRLHGWTSLASRDDIGTGPKKTPTSEIVAEYLIEQSLADGRILFNHLVTEADHTIANEALSWLRSLPALAWGPDTYLGKLIELFSTGKIGHTKLGLASSLISAYLRDLDDKARRAVSFDGQAHEVPVILCRTRIRGTILGIKDVYDAYGQHLKVRVQSEEGYTLYGSLPAALEREGAEEGDFISFEARITQSDRDPFFGFFSRPLKGQIITKAVPSDS